MTARFRPSTLEDCHCGAQILWCTTENEMRIALDHQPAEAGVYELVAIDEVTCVARAVPVALQHGRTDLRRAHFMTCRGQASRVRRR